MSNFNPVRINPSRNPGNAAMQFARKALLDKLTQEPGTPKLAAGAPRVPPAPGPPEGGQGLRGVQTLKAATKHRG